MTGPPYEPEPEPDLDNRFTHHPPFGDQPRRYRQIRELGRMFAEAAGELCPRSRERSLALTKIEEAVMWANAAIARNETAPGKES